MQAYHDVDVLIIDDIQNIIGKRASVDYFFQLMDEFIRNNKKSSSQPTVRPKT